MVRYTKNKKEEIDTWHNIMNKDLNIEYFNRETIMGVGIDYDTWIRLGITGHNDNRWYGLLLNSITSDMLNNHHKVTDCIIKGEINNYINNKEYEIVYIDYQAKTAGGEGIVNQIGIKVKGLDNAIETTINLWEKCKEAYKYIMCKATGLLPRPGTSYKDTFWESNEEARDDLQRTIRDYHKLYRECIIKYKVPEEIIKVMLDVTLDREGVKSKVVGWN